MAKKATDARFYTGTDGTIGLGLPISDLGTANKPWMHSRPCNHVKAVLR
jgi:hypothetical protein